MLKDRLYDYDVTVIKKYGDTDICRVSTVRSIRKKGVVDDTVRSPPSIDGKLLQSVSRSRKVVLEYLLCNNWDYFITLTFDKNKVDSRYNLDDLHKEFSKFIKAYNRKFNCCVKYVIVPEKHKDGAFHLHGVIKGIPSAHLQINNNGYLDWLPYAERFGFCSIDKIKDRIKCAYYIVKYISKAFDYNIPAFGHLYYCSRGLNKAEKIGQGHLCISQGDITYTYKNEYCKIKECNTEIAYNIKELLK